MTILEATIGGSRLAKDYLARRPEALAFYGRTRPDSTNPADLVATLDSRWSDARRREAAALFRGRAAQSDRIGKFISERGFVVTTGQQAGFLTGPLYTISKALGAIAHAARLEAQTGRPVLPVFWIASEDHDWEEAESALILDDGGSPVRIRTKAVSEPANRSVYKVPVDGIEETLATLQRIWPDGPFAAEAAQAIRDAHSAGGSLADACEHLLDRLLGDFGLLIVQAHDLGLKKLSAPVLAAAVEGAATRGAALAEQGQRLEEAGYHQQVTWAAGATNVFLATDRGRERLHRTDRGFRIGGVGPAMPLTEILELMDADLSRATPDALLRPVVEASVFPVLSYVAGPGEIAYYAQNDPLYEASDVVRPDLVARPAVCVVEPKIQRALDRIGLDPLDVGGPLHVLQTRLARSAIPPDVYDIIAHTREVFDDGIAALGAAAADIDPTMEGPVSQAGRRGRQSLERAEKKIMQAVKRKSGEALAHLDRARAGLYPIGAPQERVVNVFNFLGRYGLAFMQDLYEAVTNQVRRE